MPKGGIDGWVQVCGEVSGGGAGGAGRMDADGMPAVWGKGREGRRRLRRGGSCFQNYYLVRSRVGEILKKRPIERLHACLLHEYSTY